MACVDHVEKRGASNRAIKRCGTQAPSAALGGPTAAPDIIDKLLTMLLGEARHFTPALYRIEDVHAAEFALLATHQDLRA